MRSTPEAQKAFTESNVLRTDQRQGADLARRRIARTAASAMDKMIPVDWIALAKVRDPITEQWRRKVIPLSR